jgi:hypothetical protein
MEDWWLVRDPENHIGWALGRMIDVDAPWRSHNMPKASASSQPCFE